MPTFTQRPLENIEFKSNETKSLAIPRDMAIRAIVLRLFVEIVNTATPPTLIEDGLLKLFKKIKLTRNGSDVKFDMSCQMMNYVAKYTKGTAPNRVDPITGASTTATSEVLLRLDFATNALNQRDTTALLKTRGPRLSSLVLAITFGDLDTIASANPGAITEANSGVEVALEEVTGNVIQGGNEVDVNSPGYQPIDYREVSRSVDLEVSAKGSFDDDTQKENVIPAPSNIVRNAFLVLDAGVKSDALVTDFKIQRESPIQRRIIQRRWLNFKKEQKAEYQQESLDIGFLYLDYVDLLGIGLINNGAEGDVKYRFLKIASATGDLLDIYTKSFAVAAQT